MQDYILEKLELNLKTSNQSKSNYWIQHLKNIDYKDINKTGGWGNYTQKHFLKSQLHNLGQFYLYGSKVFKSKIYKLYKEYFDKYDRQIDYHVIKHILMLEKIEKYLINSKKICTIGDGKLNFILGAKLLNPSAQFFVINLPEVLVNDYAVIREMNFLKDEEIEVISNEDENIYSENKKLYLIPASAANFCKNKGIDFFSNIHSMMEMRSTEIRKYFDIIKNNKAYFYCNNRIHKPGVGDDDDFYYEKMPWNNAKIIFKDQCNVCLKFYNFRPPNIRNFDEKFIETLAKFD